MSSSFPTGGFGAGIPTDGMWQAMEQLRSSSRNESASRMGRGDVRAAVLALLAEKPMHGYQIIQEIEERSGGAGSRAPARSTRHSSCWPTKDLIDGRRVRTVARPTR